jgi:ABC-type uncharacterized transport system fused permease/ATPase subunit
MLAGVLVALLLAINGLNVVNSYVGRDFMTAIERRDSRGFVNQAVLYAAVFAISAFAAVIYRFTEERLGLLWREWFHPPADRHLSRQGTSTIACTRPASSPTPTSALPRMSACSRPRRCRSPSSFSTARSR